MLNSSHLGVEREPAGSAVPAVGRSLNPRERILDAVIATASYRGYDRTTIERVLQTAEVPAAVFDEHSDNKEDCFLQALDALIARMERRVLERVERAVRRPERVRSGLGGLLSALAEDPDGARLVVMECCLFYSLYCCLSSLYRSLLFVPTAAIPICCPPTPLRRWWVGSPRSCTAAHWRIAPANCPA